MSGYCLATSITTLRQNCETSSTFDLSTLQTFLRRFPASLNAVCVTRSTSLRVYDMVLKPRSFVDPARLAVVQPAGQLADDDHVRAFHHVILQRRGIHQRRPRAHRTQIREHVQHLAKAQQARFRTLAGRSRIELGQSHGAHQRGIGFGSKLLGFLGKRRAGLMNGYAAEQSLGQFQSVAEFLADGFQHFHRRGGHFRSNPVAGQQQYL